MASFIAGSNKLMQVGQINFNLFFKKSIKINGLEKVQRRASGCALRSKGGNEMSHEERLKILQWPTLEN